MRTDGRSCSHWWEEPFDNEDGEENTEEEKNEGDEDIHDIDWDEPFSDESFVKEAYGIRSDSVERNQNVVEESCSVPMSTDGRNEY